MLKEIIDRFYLDQEEDRGRSHFYVTDAGKCPRSIFFKFKNAPKRKIEANILRLFDHGDYIHKLIMRSLLSTREIHIVASEVNIPPQEIISGRADAIISDGKELYVLDIKSINSMGFKYLNKPKEDNIKQLQLYLHYFKIQKGILLYVNKDNQTLKEFIVAYNQDLARSLLEDINKTKENIDKDIVPSSLLGYPTNSQCRYCLFKEICSIAGRKEISWEQLKEKIKLKN